MADFLRRLGSTLDVFLGTASERLGDLAVKIQAVKLSAEAAEKLLSDDVARTDPQALSDALRGLLVSVRELVGPATKSSSGLGGCILAKDSKSNKVFVGGLGAGIGQMWVKFEDSHKSYPGWNDAPEQTAPE